MGCTVLPSSPMECDAEEGSPASSGSRFGGGRNVANLFLRRELGLVRRREGQGIMRPNSFLLDISSSSGMPTHGGSPSYAVDWSGPSIAEGRLLAFATDKGETTIVDTRGRCGDGMNRGWLGGNVGALCLWPNKNSVFDVKWMGNTPRIATGGGDMQVRLVDVSYGEATPREIWSHSLHRGSVKSLGCCPGSEHLLASGGRDGLVHLCDTRQRPPTSAPSSDCSSPVWTYSVHSASSSSSSSMGSVTAVQWLACGRYLLIGEHDGSVRALDVRMRHKPPRSQGRGRKRPLSSIFPEQGVASSSAASNSSVGHELLASLKGRRCDGVSSLTSSSCGSRVAIGLVSGVTRVYGVTEGAELVHELDCVGGDFGTFYNRSSMSPCGSYVVGKDYKDALIWDVSRGRTLCREGAGSSQSPVVRLKGHVREVTATAWSKNVGDLHLATTADDRVVRTWSSNIHPPDVVRQHTHCNIGTDGDHLYDHSHFLPEFGMHDVSRPGYAELFAANTN